MLTKIKRIHKYWRLYVFLALPLLYLLIFKYYPMIGAQIAFRKFRTSGGIWGSPWVGLANFEKFFSSYQFSRVFVNTLKLAVYQVVANFPFPIIFALLLNVVRNERWKKSVQTVVYMPYFISVIVLVSMINQMFNANVGLYNTVYKYLSGGGLPPELLGSATAFPHLYVWSGVWQTTGWNSVIYIAALSTVDPELHEAGQVDGMNRFQRMLHIDLPCIVPTITILLILNVGRSMNIGFEKIYLMQNDMNLSASEVISTYTYKVGLNVAGSNFSYATAIGLFNSVINLALITSVNFICRKIGDTSLW